MSVSVDYLTFVNGDIDSERGRNRFDLLEEWAGWWIRERRVGASSATRGEGRTGVYSPVPFDFRAVRICDRTLASQLPKTLKVSELACEFVLREVSQAR